MCVCVCIHKFDRRKQIVFGDNKTSTYRTSKSASLRRFVLFLCAYITYNNGHNLNGQCLFCVKLEREKDFISKLNTTGQLHGAL